MALLDHLGKPMPSPSEGSRRNKGVLQASVDAGLDIPELTGHWRHADHLGPNTAISKEIRASIRSKARMERSQNSYLTGILQTLSNFIVGTGPRLQMQIRGADGKPDRELNADIEQEFTRWAKHVRLAEHLRTAVAVKRLDGEVFTSVVRNPNKRESTGYGLAIQLFEADQVEVQSMYSSGMRTDGGDGIKYDRYGNPTKYPVLRQHPGELNRYEDTTSSIQWIPADYMAHMYRIDRPGQKRGVSEILTALPLFAMLRRMTMATITNVEKSSNITGVLETDAEFDEYGNPLSAITDEDWMTTLPTGRNSLMTLPNGMKLKEFAGATPNSEYSEFARSIIREIARCLNVPYNIAAGDSSSYNYASGRLDHQSFFSANDVERSYIECTCLDMILGQWLKVYYAREFGVNPAEVDAYNKPHSWFWDSVGHIDENKSALAAERQLRYGGASRGAILAKQGLDVDAVDERAAEELGYESVQEYRQAIARYLHGEAKDEMDDSTEDRPNNKPENNEEDN